MARIIVGVVFIGTFLLALSIQKEGYVAVFLPRGIIFLLVPGVVLACFGVRARTRRRSATEASSLPVAQGAGNGSEHSITTQKEPTPTPVVVELAVIGHAAGHGQPVTFSGTDADGNSVQLADLTGPALLVVPRDTLRHLKQNKELWRRVTNPSVSDEEAPESQQMQKGDGADRLAAIFAGPMIDKVRATSLRPGEFFISLADNYHDAQLKVVALKYMRSGAT